VRSNAELAVAVATVVVVGACTKPNPDYCDNERPCASGTCNLATHSCEETTDDGPVVDSATSVDANEACALAGGQVVFITTRDGDGEVATVLADGSDYHSFSTASSNNGKPTWSPDGRAIAYLGDEVGYQLYILGTDGTDSQSVSAGQAQEPEWFPDNERILFETMRDGPGEIYVVNRDGSGLTNLTMNAGNDAGASLRSDGLRIVFQSDRGEGIEVYAMAADGSDQTRLTTMSVNVRYPVWSPDGSNIAFRYGETQELWVMTAGGSGPQMIAPGPATGGVEWSPDGELLAYSDGQDIFTVTAFGAGLNNLTNGNGANNAPRWTSDGTRLIFRSTRDGNSEVYSMSADGTNLINLTNDPNTDQAADWSDCP
jgi:Tol biopolymer transport system component